MEIGNNNNDNDESGNNSNRNNNYNYDKRNSSNKLEFIGVNRGVCIATPGID